MSLDSRVLCVDLESPQGSKKKRGKKITEPCSSLSCAHVQSMAIPQSTAQASHLFLFPLNNVFSQRKISTPYSPSGDSTSLIIKALIEWLNLGLSSTIITWWQNFVLTKPELS